MHEARDFSAMLFEHKFLHPFQLDWSQEEHVHQHLDELQPLHPAPLTTMHLKGSYHFRVGQVTTEECKHDTSGYIVLGVAREYRTEFADFTIEKSGQIKR